MKWMIGIAAVVILGWIGYTVGQVYFDNSSLESMMGTVAEDILGNRSRDPKAAVLQQLDLYRCTYDPEKVSVEVSPDGRKVNIAFSYSRAADLIMTQIPLHFDIKVERTTARILQSVQDSVDSANQTQAQKYENAVKNATQKQESAP